MINNKYKPTVGQFASKVIEHDIPNTIQVSATSGLSMMLPRLPFIVLIRPRREGDVVADANTHYINIRASIEKEAQLLRSLCGEKTTNRSVISTAFTDANNVTFHIKSSAAQEYQMTHPQSWLRRWWAPPPPVVNISLFEDDDEHLIEASRFDGYVYLVYGNEEIVELKRFDPIVRAAERYIIIHETPDCRPSNERYEHRRQHVGTEISENIYRKPLLQYTPYLYPDGLIVPATRSEMTMEKCVKMLQSALLELNQLPQETIIEANYRMDVTQARIKRNFTQENEPGCVLSCVQSMFH